MGVCFYDICDQILKSKRSVLCKWCLKISREIAHVLPRFRFERDESRDAEYMLSSRSSQHREHVISSRSSLTWGEQEQLPLMFSAHNNSSPCMLSFTIFFFFFLWKLKKIRYQFLYVIVFCIQCIKKNKKKTRNWKGKAGALETCSYLFFPSLFFSMYIYEDSLSFFFYLISFCTGINTKTEGKKTRN